MQALGKFYRSREVRATLTLIIAFFCLENPKHAVALPICCYTRTATIYAIDTLILFKDNTYQI